MTLAFVLVMPVAAAAVGRLAPGRWSERGQLLFATLMLAFGLTASVQVFAGGPRSEGLLYLDSLGALLLAVIAVVGWAGAGYAIGYLRHDVEAGRLAPDQPRWFYFWYHLFLGAMIAVATTENLGLVWVTVEATAVFSAILVGFYRTREALEAAWKYLIICTVGISL